MKPSGDIVAVLPKKTRIPRDELTKAMLPGESVTVTGPLLRRGEAQMPWLKAAYLSVFSLLGSCGYWYAEGSAIQQIRRQILVS